MPEISRFEIEVLFFILFLFLLFWLMVSILETHGKLEEEMEKIEERKRLEEKWKI